MKIIPFVLSALFFSLSCYVLAVGLSTTGAITLTISSDNQSLSKFYVDNSLRKPKYSEKKSSQSKKLPGEKIEDIQYRFLTNPAVNWIRFDPGEHPGVTRIYGMVVYRAIGRKTQFSAKEIYDGFRPGSDGVEIRLKKDYVEIISTVDDRSSSL